MAERLTVTLHELVYAMDTYADALLRRDHGLTFNEFEYLTVVAQLDSPDITTLAACLRLTKAAVSKRLPALEAAGLVVRGADRGNARRVLVHLTERGAQMVEQAGAALDAQMAQVLRPDGAGAPAIDPDLLNDDLATLLTRVLLKEIPR